MLPISPIPENAMSGAQDSAATQPPAQPIRWLAGSFSGILLLALVAARLPNRFKLLGLFSLMWGTAAGWGLRWWAGECRVEKQTWLSVAAFALVAAGEISLVLVAWQIYCVDLRRQFARDPSAMLIQQARQSVGAGQTPEQAELLRQLKADEDLTRSRRQQALELSTYLQQRLRKPVDQPENGRRIPPRPNSWQDWPYPLPELFWSGEVVLGSLCGWIVFRKR